MGYAARVQTERTAINGASKVYKGRIERFVSGPLADGFAIVSLSTSGGTRITLRGRNILSGFKVGEMIEVRGKQMQHPKYGLQIDVKDARYIELGTSGLVRWLAEAGIDGVGEATARKIVDTLGAEAVTKIVEGTSEAKILLGNKYEAVREVLAVRYGESKYGSMLASFDIGPALRSKIYQHYLDRTGEVIAKNPYSLIHSIEGIAFTTADQIARGAGLAIDSAERMMAAAQDTLRIAETEGHSWQTQEDVIKSVARKTGLMIQLVARKLTDAEWEGAVPVTVETDEGERRGWAIGRLAFKEAAIAREVTKKLREPKRMQRDAAKALVVKQSAIAKVTLNDLQTEAAIMALIEPFSIITGNPGTGKTTVLNIITRCWKALGREIALAAPTGKAAQRMFEATEIRSKTLHRLLGADGRGFSLGKSNPIRASAIAIDEGSMIDIDLGFAFSQAWGHSQTLLLGDADQLASVGAGRVFGDLVAADAVPTVRLTEIMRQKKGSNIAVGAEMIRSGQMPEWGGDLQFIEMATNEEIAEEVIALSLRKRAAGSDVQILTPGHATEAGTINLNTQLAVDRCNHNDRSIKIAGDLEARVGDKVIQLDNDKERDVFNGDSGRLVAIKGTEHNPIAVIEMDGGTGPTLLEYTRGQFKELTLSHALTVHKAQGSEYAVVIIPMTSSHWRLLRRTLLNTGMTRAKKQCIIIGQMKALRQAIDNDDSNERMTQLRQFVDALAD